MRTTSKQNEHNMDGLFYSFDNKIEDQDIASMGPVNDIQEVIMQKSKMQFSEDTKPTNRDEAEPTTHSL